MSLPFKAKVKLASNVQELREEALYGVTKYNFDHETVYTVEKYEGYHRTKMGKNTQLFRISGGFCQPADKPEVDVPIWELLIPLEALIPQEQQPIFTS